LAVTYMEEKKWSRGIAEIEISYWKEKGLYKQVEWSPNGLNLLKLRPLKSVMHTPPIEFVLKYSDADDYHRYFPFLHTLPIKYVNRSIDDIHVLQVIDISIHYFLKKSA
jgi:hypothetical protein